jgi:AcrR family transcriptional regulator
MAAAVTSSAGALPSKGERTRQRLLEIAVERFGADGFRRTSVSAIARDAGITQAAVYAYFANKEALFEAAVDEDAEALVQDAEAAIDPSLPVRERLLLMILHLRSGLDGHPLTRRVLGGQEPEVINRLLTLPVLQRLEAGLTLDLEASQQDGTVSRAIDPPVVAEGILTIVLTLLMAGVQVGEQTSIQRQGGVIAVLDALFRTEP